MKLFKIFIPSGSTKEISEVESWTLKWKTQGESYGTTAVNHKCFTSKDDAEEFEKALDNAASLLNVWVRCNITKN